MAQLLDLAGVDMILVGDSLAMVSLGHKTTLPLTLEKMLHHGVAVRRGVKRAFVVCDLPFLSYQKSKEYCLTQAIHTTGRVLKETEVQGLKLEGGHPAVVETVAQLTAIGIPVMGHVGLTPQSVHRLGYRQQGQTETDAKRIISEGMALSEVGAFAVVLEHIPSDLVRIMTSQLPTLTTGIGANYDCDGQVLVTADLLGLSGKKTSLAHY